MIEDTAKKIYEAMRFEREGETPDWVDGGNSTAQHRAREAAWEITHFNGLSPAQAERLAILSEELGEAQQSVGKILRHGYKSYHPEHPEGPNNREALERELGDILGLIIMMDDAADVSGARIRSQARQKQIKVQKYTHHQPSATVDDIIKRGSVYHLHDQPANTRPTDGGDDA